MSDRESLTPELKAVEAALSSLVPMPPTGTERDCLMFAAGRAAAVAPRRSWIWPMAIAATALAALIVGRRTAPQPAGIPAPQIAQSITIEPDAGAFVATVSPSSYFQLRRNLDRFDFRDIDVGSTDTSVSRHPSNQALLHELLN